MKLISYRYASEVSIGDELLVKENSKLLPAKVVNMSSFMMEGKCLSLDVHDTYLPYRNFMFYMLN